MILLSPHATQTLGLALHELCDNALKHGALSNDEGHVSLVWRIDESGAEPNFEMTWRERGGPPVKREPDLRVRRRRARTSHRRGPERFIDD